MNKTESMWTRNFICTMCANLCLTLSYTSVNTLVSSYAGFLGAGSVLAGMLTGIFFGVSILTRPFTGPLIPKYDNRKLMLATYALGIIVYAGYAASNSIGSFLAFRLVNGVQYGIVGSLHLTAASNSLPKSKIGVGVGIFGLSNSVAQSFGPAIGAAIRDWGTAAGGAAFGYRCVFIFASAVMVIALIPSFLLLPDDKASKLSGASAPWYKSIIDKSVLPTAVMIMLVMTSYTLYSAYLVPYAAEKGIGGVSIFFTVAALIMIVVKPLSGRLSDRIGFIRIIGISILFLIVSLVIVSRAKTLGALLVGAVFTALGQGGAYPALQTMGIQCVAPARRGIASTTLFFGIDLGFFLGPLLGGVVNAHSGYSTMYMTGVAPCVLALVLLAFAWPAFKRRRAVLDAEDAAKNAVQTDIHAV